MPGYLLHAGAGVLCTHAGTGNIITTNTRVLVNKQPVAVIDDNTTVAGCPFQIPAAPTKPQPCLTIQWTVGATRVRAGGKPVLLQSSTGLCKSAEQIPQGPPNVTTTQVKVKGI